MITTGIHILYALVGLYTFWRLTGQLAWKFLEKSKAAFPLLNAGLKSPNGANWTGAIIVGAGLALIWPLVLPLSLIIERSGYGFSSIFYVPRSEKERIQAERIRTLERELGIKNDRS